MLTIMVAAKDYEQRECTFQTSHSRHIIISVLPEDSRVVAYSSAARRHAGWTLQRAGPGVSCHIMDLMLRNTPSGVFRAGHFSHLAVHNRLCRWQD